MTPKPHKLKILLPKLIKGNYRIIYKRKKSEIRIFSLSEKFW